jgi:hypothetical protein
VAAVVKVLLVVGLLTVHAPAWKVVGPSSHSDDAPRSAREVGSVAKSCCSKCGKKAKNRGAVRTANSPAAPKPEPPAEPCCPAGCPCPLCTHAAAVILPPTLAAGHEPRSTDSLALASHSPPTDGFRLPLDRPPRA